MSRINKPEYIIIHHTGGTDEKPLADTSNQKFKVIDDYHKEKWKSTSISSLGFYCGYHYFIDKTGLLTQARNDNDEGCHCLGYNLNSIGVCLAGNFDLTLPTIQQEQSLSKLLSDLTDKYNIKFDNIVPHRKFANKTCYGINLKNDWAKNLTIGYKISYLQRMLVNLINLLKNANKKSI